MDDRLMQVSRREALFLAVLPAFPVSAALVPFTAGHVSFVQGLAWWDARGEGHRAPLASRPSPARSPSLDWYANVA